jgi:glycerol kinase
MPADGSQPCIVAIDKGTSSTRAIAFDYKANAWKRIRKSVRSHKSLLLLFYLCI